ncbi:hypothetical protein CWB72_09345 [Pseudoalteromonas phenolica]|uniref:TonB-dependent receptor plug domain-containing protein n=1 Tax=Pseudoalteromonas phenolica TaxID=161398 RepID=UPI00110AA0B0|nr:TonB-dependent receptor [Pseudoalteromonas phenolica]TMN90121.1 hypothetical protein CWB72_09345 [Pseudoalteromonas phenolica]
MNNNKILMLSPLALAVSLSISASATAAEQNQVEEKVERIEVTSSRIKRTELEGVTNIQTISSADMVRSGFTNVYEALSSVTAANGQILGEVETGSYTPGAKELKLRGLGPEYTLILVNGKRLAYYPMPYGGQTNFVNLDMIPTAMVDRIDIQTGGASAIYGSDAMAGVVNIITKKGIDSHYVDAYYGQDTYGKGDKKGLTFVGGFQKDAFTFDYALEYKHTDPLLSGDRPIHDSVWDNPHPDARRDINRSITVYAQDTEYKNQYSDQYCNTEQNPHPRAVKHFIEFNGYGSSCGWDETSDKLLRNQSEAYSLYINSEYQLNEQHSLFANGFYIDQEKKGRRNALFWGNHPQLHGSAFWDPDIVNKDGGLGAPVYYMWRTVADEEYTPDGLGRTYNDTSLSFNVGIKGEIGDYYYSIGYSRANYDFNDRYLNHTNEANRLLKGEQYGEVNGLPVYRPNYELWFSPLTPDTYTQLADWATYDGNSFNNTFTADITGDLFELPAGPVAFSAYIEAMNEGTRATPDARIINKEFVGQTGVITEGERDRYAAALEFLIPVTEQFDVEAAIRYDHYDDITEVGGAPTYQLGFTYRPTDSLVLRSAYSTTFRGPSMSSVYQGFSGNYGAGNDRITADACAQLEKNGSVSGYVTDALTETCSDVDLSNSDMAVLQANFETASVGDPTLREETGNSFTAGFVYEYSEHLSFNIDYYDITIKDKIKVLEAGSILHTMWECNQGILDGNSQLCKNTADRIKRYDENGKGIDRLGNTISGDAYTPHSIRQGYINASETQDGGIDLGFKGSYDSDFGTFRYKFEYNKVLKKKERIEASDPLLDMLDSQRNYDFNDTGNFSLTWQKEDTSISLLALYKGKMWNNAPYGEREKLPAWYRYNLTFGQFIGDKTRIIFSVKNLLNAMPPRDTTYRNYPFYSAGNYDSIGREFVLRMTYEF